MSTRAERKSKQRRQAVEAVGICGWTPANWAEVAEAVEFRNNRRILGLPHHEAKTWREFFAAEAKVNRRKQSRVLAATFVGRLVYAGRAWVDQTGGYGPQTHWLILSEEARFPRKRKLASWAVGAAEDAENKRQDRRRAIYVAILCGRAGWTREAAAQLAAGVYGANWRRTLSGWPAVGRKLANLGLAVTEIAHRSTHFIRWEVGGTYRHRTFFRAVDAETAWNGSTREGMAPQGGAIVRALFGCTDKSRAGIKFEPEGVECYADQ